MPTTRRRAALSAGLGAWCRWRPGSLRDAARPRRPGVFQSPKVEQISRQPGESCAPSIRPSQSRRRKVVTAFDASRPAAGRDRLDASRLSRIATDATVSNWRAAFTPAAWRSASTFRALEHSRTAGRAASRSEPGRPSTPRTRPAESAARRRVVFGQSLSHAGDGP